jgi:hypothetical protein
MEIAAGQQFMLELIHPNNLLDVLAFGAMPVTAGIIAYALMAATVTMGHMASHCRSAAMHYSIKCLFLGWAQFEPLLIGFSKLGENTRKLNCMASVIFHGL